MSEILNLRPLSSGGYGDVFLGELSDSGQTIVVKFLRDHQLPHARRAFEREVRILKRQTRGMVRLLFANMDAKPPYYGMPYLSGTLARYAGMLTELQLGAIALHLASTISTLHLESETHGDIKPDNVLVSLDGKLHVADPLGSGAACTVFFSDKHGGTPGYWAPEVRAGQPVSQAADAYSFGATLYHVATGCKPQDGQRIDLTCRHHITSSKIREVIAACCQPDPRARPRMTEVIRVLRGRSWPDVHKARVQQEGLLAAALAGGVALLALGIFGGGSAGQRPRPI